MTSADASWERQESNSAQTPKLPPARTARPSRRPCQQVHTRGLRPRSGNDVVAHRMETFGVRRRGDVVPTAVQAVGGLFAEEEGTVLTESVPIHQQALEGARVVGTS